MIVVIFDILKNPPRPFFPPKVTKAKSRNFRKRCEFIVHIKVQSRMSENLIIIGFIQRHVIIPSLFLSLRGLFFHWVFFAERNVFETRMSLLGLIILM